MPPVVVITAEEARYYQEACMAFESIGNEDAYSEWEVKELYPGLTQGAACDWAIYGFTVHGWLNFEGQLNSIAGYTEKLRSHIDFLEQVIKNLEAAASKQEAAILEE